MTKAGISARIYARRNNINIQLLLDMLSYWRPYDTYSERYFISQYVDTIDGIQRDEIGNRFLRIPNADGSQSNVLWSCHTDSVHSTKGCDKVRRQNLKWDEKGNIIGLNDGKPGQCLGADDGAGMWLMMQMIEQGKPGLYIFHRGEEKGGIGSYWIEKNTPELLDGIDIAMAFDRRALTSVITHQRGGRCCSDDFGNSLAAELGLGYKLDTGGSFTDTAVYTDLVGECTNVSCGYYSEHGPRETCDVSHLIRLREKLLALDTSKLVIKREPGEYEPKYKSYSYAGGSNYAGNSTSTQAKTNGVTGAGSSASTKRNTQLSSQDRVRRNAKVVDIRGDDSKKYDEYWKSVAGDDRDLAGEDDDSGSRGGSIETLRRLVVQYPGVAARLLYGQGVTGFDFADELLEGGGLSEDEEVEIYQFFTPDVDENDTVQCGNCYSQARVEDVLVDGECPFCYESLIEVLEEAGYFEPRRMIANA